MRQYPKVIVTSVDAWRDDVGANTLPNLFADWDSSKVNVVYTRPELPQTHKCNSFFRIMENEVLHTVLHPGKQCGQRVYNESANSAKNVENITTQQVLIERKRYHFFRNHRLTVFYLIREIMWSLGGWKSKELDCFLDECDADVLFIPIYPYSYMNKIQTYIAKKTGLRGVAWIADDNYSYKPEWYNPMFWIRRYFLRKSIDELMQYCDELLVILPKLEEEYKEQFNLPINILTKGIDIPKKNYGNRELKLPLKIVYTGNLFIGRDKTLVKVVNAIKKINKTESKIQLDIYSHIPLSDKLKKRLNVEGCSTFKGGVPISETEKIQRDADIVLFVEGLDFFNRYKARLSFSTKLTDYFKSGKCIFAVGKRDIAPIDYLMKNECAIVATTEQEIFEQLSKIIREPEKINTYGEKALKLGIEKHSKEAMNSVLYESLLKSSKQRTVAK